MRPGVVIFDLDGTLSDSGPGILASLRHAFDAVGLPPLDDGTGRSLLGPPFHESLPPLVGAARAPAVIAAYREHYGRAGMFDTKVYDGIDEVLGALHARGARLAVATSKPEHFVGPILRHLGLDNLFETVCGDERDGSFGTKALVIGKALGRLGHPRASDVLMVGDRSHDVLGARAHGLDCIGAGWGYGLPGEVAAAGALAICASPVDLGRMLHLDARAS